MFSTTEHDRERLELLHEQLEDLRRECSCGIADACDECGGRGLPRGFYVVGADYDTLHLTIRLTDLDTTSKFARRFMMDDEFARIGRQIFDMVDDAEDAARAAEAAEYVADIRGADTPRASDMEATALDKETE